AEASAAVTNKTAAEERKKQEPDRREISKHPQKDKYNSLIIIGHFSSSVNNKSQVELTKE
ncbi:MAG: hypothetical protein IJ482_01640, partial [Alphaproteobacteria bacterium]|nr:hypothetical protein [Alphaproteobacteria bacterium]